MARTSAGTADVCWHSTTQRSRPEGRLVFLCLPLIFGAEGARSPLINKGFLWKPTLKGLIDPQRAFRSVETRSAPNKLPNWRSRKAARRTHVAEVPGADHPLDSLGLLL